MPVYAGVAFNVLCTSVRQMTTPLLLENNSLAPKAHISKDLLLSVICLLPSQNLKMTWENNWYCNESIRKNVTTQDHFKNEI